MKEFDSGAAQGRGYRLSTAAIRRGDALANHIKQKQKRKRFWVLNIKRLLTIEPVSNVLADLRRCSGSCSRT
jgi:hypothetical protein